jgi:hypothetical protein
MDYLEGLNQFGPSSFWLNHLSQEDYLYSIAANYAGLPETLKVLNQFILNDIFDRD